VNEGIRGGFKHISGFSGISHNFSSYISVQTSEAHLLTAGLPLCVV